MFSRMVYKFVLLLSGEVELNLMPKRNSGNTICLTLYSKQYLLTIVPKHFLYKLVRSDHPSNTKQGFVCIY